MLYVPTQYHTLVIPRRAGTGGGGQEGDQDGEEVMVISPPSWMERGRLTGGSLVCGGAKLGNSVSSSRCGDAPA